MNYAFIYNPAARRGKSGSKVQALKREIRSVPGATLFQSTYKGDIPKIIEELLPQFDVFVACGGDGTIREVASKLIHTKKKMGIIPMGTGNDLCKTLKIPVDLQKSLELLWCDRSIKMDVGQCNDFIFLNTLGFGFDGLVNRYATEINNIHPLLRYAFAALKATVFHEQFGVGVTTGEITVKQEAIMISLANGRVEGGAFWIAPGASVTDGKIELVIVKSIRKWKIPFYLTLFLLKKPEWIPVVQSKKVDNITVEFDSSVEIHADGEIINNAIDKFHIYMVPNALEVICGL